MKPIFHCIPVLLASFTVTLAQEAPRLTILPADSPIRRDKNNTGFFTCTASKEHQDLITDIIWLDPRGNEVPDERQSRIYSSTASRGMARELFVTKIRDEDSGKYTCKARYGSNQEITKSFELLVYMRIRWEDAPRRQNPVTGSDALIRCVVKANPPAIIEWFRGTEIVEDSDRFTAQDDGLLIRDVTSEDDGSYTCRAKVPDEGEMDERVIEVEVYSPPEITAPEKNAEVVVTEGDVRNTRCIASGKPVPSWSWVTADGTDAATIDGITVNTEDGMLTFDPARRSMAGEYRCIATNHVATAETTVRVVVNVKPEVVSYENVSFSEGAPARLACHVTGSPLPTVLFRRVGSDVSFEEGVSAADGRVSVELNERDRVRIAVMTISDVTRDDDGAYECVATNTGGLTTLPGLLTVQYPPSLTSAAPSEEVFTWIDNSANLSCVVEAVPNATVTWRFAGRPIDGDTQLVKSQYGAVHTLTVTPVDSDYFGMYTCEASNPLGSESLSIELREATEPGRVADAVVRDLTATSVEFDLPTPVDNGGLPVQRYRVQYVNKGQPWPSNIEVELGVGAPYLLLNLDPEQDYVFRFAAENAVGLGQWSEPLGLTMPDIGVPQAPSIAMEARDYPAALQDVQGPPVVPSSLPDAYVLNWQSGADNGADIEVFQISYYKVINNKNQWRVVSEKHTSVVDAYKELSYRLSSLKPESFYRVELRARNRIGYGDPAQIIVHTAPGVTAEPAPSSLASSMVVGVVVGVLLVLILLIDLTCYAVNNRGITHMLCSRGGSQSTKLSDEAASEKEPLQTNGNDSKPVPESNGERVIRLPRQTSV